MTRKQKWLPIAAVLVIYLGFSLYRLRDLPGEWFGDISIVHEEVLDILRNPWEWKYNLSAGPLYHHWVAIWAYFLGPNYLTYKLASVSTGLVGIALIYLLAQELFGMRLGLLTATLAATSCWYLIWSRLGSSPQILSPVLTAGVGYLMVRYERTMRWPNLFWAEVVAGLGWFSYPAMFVLPFIPLALAILTKKSKKTVAMMLLVLVIMSLGFGQMVRRQPDLFSRGYIGEKIFNPKGSFLEMGYKVGVNMVKTLGMFNFRGDEVFRINVAKSPHLDRLSGILMILGLGYLLIDTRLQKKWVWVVLPLLMLLLPAISPGIPPQEIPSASRTFGVVPFVYILVGLGVEWFGQWFGTQIYVLARSLAKSSPARLAAGGMSARANFIVPAPLVLGTVGCLLVVIGYLNANKYFGAYAWGLPDHNQAWGKYMAEYIDGLPATTQVNLTGCCWGAWGQPEPKGIYYVLKQPEGRLGILNGWLTGCEEVDREKETVIFFDPIDTKLQNKFTSCFPGSRGEMHYDKIGQKMFYILEVKVDR